MRILLAGYTIPGSGAKAIPSIAGVLWSLAAELRKRHDVQLYVRNDRPFPEPWVHGVAAPKASWLLYPRFLAGALRKTDADVYHGDYVASGAALAAAGRRPRVVSFNDAIPFQERPAGLGNRLRRSFYFRWFEACRSADALVAMSEDAKRDAVEFAGVPAEQVHVVYNGIDAKRYRPLLRRPHERLRIGYLGGLDGRKNVGLLLDAYDLLAGEREDIELHVAGSGANLERFRTRSLPRATFRGFLPQDRVVPFYNSLDVFAFPTLKEGFGLMALEAMACGTPVVALNRTSMPEVVGDAGLLTENDPAALAKAIGRLLDSPALRKRLAAKGRKRAEAFTWARCARNMEKVYQTVLGTR